MLPKLDIKPRIVYEREEPEPNNLLPHLWRYRTIVNLEHFSQSFSSADVSTKDKCQLVSKFLREENKLFVTRYLPDIVQLQRRVRDKFLHKLDRREAVNTTIREFLDRIRNGKIPYMVQGQRLCPKQNDEFPSYNVVHKYYLLKLFYRKYTRMGRVE